MNLETVEKCYTIFEEKTGRKITQEEKESIIIACVIGENYGCKKFVNTLKNKNKRGC
jgi:hypothetical protein